MSLSYYAQVKRRGTELLVAAPGLKLPASIVLTTMQERSQTVQDETVESQ